MKVRDLAMLFVWLAAVGVLLGKGGVPVLMPVDSPFPDKGRWLLIAAESSELSGAEVAGNAESVRNYPGLNRRVLDYDKATTDEPWSSALAWAADKSGSKPYYIVRHGNKASEDFLTGSTRAMVEQLNQALEATD